MILQAIIKDFCRSPLQVSFGSRPMGSHSQTSGQCNRLRQLHGLFTRSAKANGWRIILRRMKEKTTEANQTNRRQAKRTHRFNFCPNGATPEVVPKPSNAGSYHNRWHADASVLVTHNTKTNYMQRSQSVPVQGQLSPHANLQRRPCKRSDFDSRTNKISSCQERKLRLLNFQLFRTPRTIVFGTTITFQFSSCWTFTVRAERFWL